MISPGDPAPPFEPVRTAVEDATGPETPTGSGSSPEAPGLLRL